MTKEQAVDAIVKAWLNPGPAPIFHREAQVRLKREWPTLANAIEALVKTHKEK